MVVEHSVTGVTARRGWSFDGIRLGLVVLGVLLVGVGIAYALSAGGLVDPDVPALGDDPADDESPGDEPDDGSLESEAVDSNESDEESDRPSNDTDGGERTELDGSVLSITVVGPAGERIEGATVNGTGAPQDDDSPLEFGGETDADGTYTDEIGEAEYTIDVDHPAYEPTTVEHEHDGEGEVSVELQPDGDGESRPSTSQLTIRVVDTDGDPIEGASVYGEGEPREADVPLVFRGETGPDGNYTDVIYENEYTVEIDHPDYEERNGTVTHDGEQAGLIELEAADDDRDG